jgi:class 3 adenylate cyclase
MSSAAPHALLLTDIVDSTRLTERLEESAASALWAAHDRLARDLIPKWRGREVDKTDGMLILFESIKDAVGYALEYQRMLRERALGIAGTERASARREDPQRRGLAMPTRRGRSG